MLVIVSDLVYRAILLCVTCHLDMFVCVTLLKLLHYDCLVGVERHWHDANCKKYCLVGGYSLEQDTKNNLKPRPPPNLIGHDTPSKSYPGLL